jgi:two-component system, NarL family, sensor kinase
VGRFVIALSTVGVAAMLVVAIAGMALMQQLAESHAIDEARTLTRLDALKVQNRLTDSMVRPGARNYQELDDLVRQVVQPNLGGPVVRVKIWRVEDAVGEVIYSDVPGLVGLREPLEYEQLHAARTGVASAELSQLDDAEHEYEHGLGPLTEVYIRIYTPNRQRLLFETYQRSALITRAGREIAGTFTPVLVGTLIVAVGLELLLATAVIRRFRRAQRDRQGLVEAVVQASFRERRIMAGDLHDGPVQEMSGLSLELAAAAEATEDEQLRATLKRTSDLVRASIRALRSAIMGIYPPDLEQLGLEGALAELLARLPAEQLSGHLSYEVDRPLDHHTSELLYRSSQEALRNVDKHAHASNVWVTVQRRNGRVDLSIRDDGRGGATLTDRQKTSTHFGLAVLADIVRDAGGSFHLASSDAGTTVAVALPV